MKYFYIFVISIAFFSFFVFNLYMQNVANSESNEIVFSVADMPYNHTYNYWVERWFNWFLSLPNVEGNESLAHPRDSYSPEKCSWNQDNVGRVWMLPDGKDTNDLSQVENRYCKVPAGKALLVQIVGSNCSMEEGLKNDKELMDCAKWFLPKAQFSATIDGKEVMNTIKNPSDRNKFYVQPFFTNITFSKNNYYGASEGVFRGAEAGYFLYIKPLPIGNHIINFKESVINTLDATGNDKRISNVQYNLEIVNNTR
jgi:hypothetical protein